MGRNAAEIRIVDAIDVGSVERVVAAGDEVQGHAVFEVSDKTGH